jgi:tRNA wybutosine-synthesizing protein 3
VTFKELKAAISSIDYPSLVEFQQTPCILHVACKTLEDAQNLVNKAKESGWKHSGIMSTAKRFMVELHSTEKLEFPVMNEGKVLINDNFLKLVIEESNKRLERVWDKIKRLEKMI